MAAFALDDFSILELTGDDRLDWLQGQATNDVRGLLPGTSLSFCLCEPTGQILAVLDAWAEESRILMVTARERAAAVLDRVERMTILEDVAAQELPLKGAWLSQPPNDDRFVALPSNRAPNPGWDVWGPVDALADLLDGAERADGDALRILAGVPKWGVDFGPRALPPELGPDFEERHVSYAKGCYTGQEVLMRMHTRGHTNRTWVGLIASGPLPPETPVLLEGREVGRVASSSQGENLWIAAATLRNEATASGTRVSVDGIEAEVCTMPIMPRSG